MVFAESKHTIQRADASHLSRPRWRGPSPDVQAASFEFSDGILPAYKNSAIPFRQGYPFCLLALQQLEYCLLARVSLSQYRRSRLLDDLGTGKIS